VIPLQAEEELLGSVVLGDTELTFGKRLFLIGLYLVFPILILTLADLLCRQRGENTKRANVFAFGGEYAVNFQRRYSRPWALVKTRSR